MPTQKTQKASDNSLQTIVKDSESEPTARASVCTRGIGAALYVSITAVGSLPRGSWLIGDATVHVTITPDQRQNSALEPIY
jgi:hypothetical protein